MKDTVYNQMDSAATFKIQIIVANLLGYATAIYSSHIQSWYQHEQFTLHSGSPHDADSICLVAA